MYIRVMIVLWPNVLALNTDEQLFKSNDNSINFALFLKRLRSTRNMWRLCKRVCFKIFTLSPWKHPQSIKETPPNFQICWKFFPDCLTSLSYQDQTRPSDPMVLILVSSDHVTCRHCCTLQLILSLQTLISSFYKHVLVVGS